MFCRLGICRIKYPEMIRRAAERSARSFYFSNDFLQIFVADTPGLKFRLCSNTLSSGSGGLDYSVMGF